MRDALSGLHCSTANKRLEKQPSTRWLSTQNQRTEGTIDDDLTHWDPLIRIITLTRTRVAGCCTLHKLLNCSSWTCIVAVQSPNPRVSSLVHTHSAGSSQTTTWIMARVRLGSLLPPRQRETRLLCPHDLIAFHSTAFNAGRARHDR